VIDLTTTNVLLGILATVAVLQTAGLIVGAMMVSRAYRRGLERVEEIERGIEQAVAPMAARAQVVFDRIDRVSERVDVGAEKLDNALSVTARGAELALMTVNGKVRHTAALATALASGGRAALRAWRSGASRRTRDVVSRETVSSIVAPINNNLHRTTEEHHVSI
jgi:hypothetical protein